MGQSMGLLPANARTNDPPKLVLVPPMFHRDLKARSRFARSSYDYLFAKPQLKWLFDDFFFAPGVRGVLFLSPPTDQRVSVKAKLGTDRNGGMSIRFQPEGPGHRNTFIDLKANPQVPQEAALRGCYYDLETGAGAFAVVPSAWRKAQVGLRYSTSEVSVGAVTAPFSQTLSTLWVAARYGGLTVGVQARPHLSLAGGSAGALPRGAYGTATTSTTSSSGALGGSSAASSNASWLLSQTSYALSYSPTMSSPTGRSSFVASVEVQEARTLVLSFYQHMAMNRKVVNPWEDRQVIGLTNYINFGVQLITPLDNVSNATNVLKSSTSGSLAGRSYGPNGGGGGNGDSDTPTASVAHAAATPLVPDEAVCTASAAAQAVSAIQIGAEWQINKNWLVKARAGTCDATAAVGFRSWFDPSVLLTACVQYDYRTGLPRFGVTLQTENHGNRLYERGASEVHGKALLQRHEADDMDMANAEGDTGTRVLRGVSEQDYNVATPRGAFIL